MCYESKLKVIQSSLTVSALVDLFTKLDTNKSGSITLNDYISICKDHGMKLDKDDLETINFLVNDNGKVIGRFI